MRTDECVLDDCTSLGGVDESVCRVRSTPSSRIE